MEYLTLNYIKSHSRLNYDDIEDSLLELYANSAEWTMAQYLNRGKTAAEMVSNLTEEFGELPVPIVHASLMLVEASYQHRIPVSPTQLYIVPYQFDTLVKPFMIL